MAAGVKALRRIQIGREGTPGTAVTETARLRLEGTIEDLQELYEAPEQIGYVGGVDRTLVVKQFAGLDLSGGLTFEQAPYFPAMMFGGPITGSADGAGSGRIYTTTIPTTTKPTLNHYTLVGGDESETERVEYGTGLEWEIAGKGWEAVTMTAKLAGRRVQRYATGFAAVTLPAVEDVAASLARLYIDPVGSAYGTTLISNQVLGFKVSYKALITFKAALDGQLYFSYPVYTGHEITGEITFEHDTAVQGNTGAKADWRAQTARRISLLMEGSALTSAGTTYSKRTMRVNLPIKWTKIGKIDEVDGNDIITGEFKSRYNITSAEAGQIIIVNEVSALP